MEEGGHCKEGAKMSTVSEESGPQESEEGAQMSIRPQEESGSHESEEGAQRFAAHLFNDGISNCKETHQCCPCVNRIIEDYNKKIEEIEGLNSVIKAITSRSQEKDTRIKRPEQVVAALAVCESCGNEMLTEKIVSLSIQETDTQVRNFTT